MARAPKLCNGDGGRCTNAQPCPVHRAKAWATSKRRMPRGWRAKRQRILERDPICRRCNQRPSTQVHHKGHRDDHRDSMLEGICDACHRQETQRQAAAARYGS